MNFMASNLICDSDGAFATSSDFRKTVKISTDLRVNSVSLVNSRSTRGLVSRNFAVRVVRLVLMMNSHGARGALRRRLAKFRQYSRKKATQLVEVIRKREMNVLSDGNLTT